MNDRSKMLMSYFIAQLIPSRYNLQGFILVLTSVNVDDLLRGNFTKYGVSSGDLDLYQTLNRNEIKKILYYFRDK